MKNIEIYNTLNIDKESSSIVATFTQEDDAILEFKLFKDGQEIVLKDQVITLGAQRKDGVVIEQDEKETFLIKEGNILNITLKKNIIAVVGVVKIQLYLKDKNGEMASNTFNINVNKKLLGAENIEATNDIKTLNTLVLELKNNTNKLIDDTKAKADKLLNGLKATGDNLSNTVKATTDKFIADTKKDYDSLKKVIVDENISIKLQDDIDKLQNGMKTNQNLSYQGSSITCKNTLEGRTESMRVNGKTMYKKQDGTYTDTWEEGVTLESFGESEGNKISILSSNNPNSSPNGNCKKDILIKQPLREWDILYEDNTNVNAYRCTIDNVLNGNEPWASLQDNPTWRKQNTFRYEFIMNKPNKLNLNDINCISSSMPSYSYDYLASNDVVGIAVASSPRGTHFGISIKKTEIKTGETSVFKEWLKNNIIPLYYKSSTPVIEIVENCVDIDLDTYKDITYVNIENNIKGTLDFSVPSNMGSIIQAHSKAINELYDLIDRLLIPNLIENKSDLAMLSLK